MTTQSTPQIAALLAARYADGQAAERLTAPDGALPAAFETLLAHRSVRAFRAEPLAQGTLEWLLAAAQSASSSSNLQSWSVVAVEDPARKQRLATLAGEQAHIREAPLLLAWLVDLARLRGIAERAGRPCEGLDYLDSFLMGAIDAALAAQNAVMAAEALGLGTVYIGALRNRPEEVARELGLPSSVCVVFGLCVGVPDPARPAAIKPRLPRASVLFREQYDAREAAAQVAAYDDAMSRFYASQKQAARRWSETSRERVEGAAALYGRDRLREALNNLGFALR